MPERRQLNLPPALTYLVLAVIVIAVVLLTSGMALVFRLAIAIAVAVIARFALLGVERAMSRSPS
jgi:hypothetical protein